MAVPTAAVLGELTTVVVDTPPMLTAGRLIGVQMLPIEAETIAELRALYRAVADAVNLNNLDDWASFYAAEIAG